jgi:hypothetical protein
MSDERRLPPVTELGMLSLALIVAAVIYLSAHLPEHVPLGPAIARWALLAYAVIAGMIEYVFLRDHTSGGPLVVLTLALAVFAVHVPVLIAFTVARYADPVDEPGRAPAPAP